MTQFAKLFSISAATLFLSLSAHAMLRPDGAFLAQQCGVQTIDSSPADSKVISACVGAIMGTAQKAVSFKLADNSMHIFKVTARQDLLMAMMSGDTMTIFQLAGENGETATMKAIMTRQGEIKSVSGDFQNSSFLVPEFRQMMTLM